MSNVARVEPKQQMMPAPAESPMGSALAFLQGGGNIEQLNQMMDLQARWEANEARKAFTAAMARFKAEPVTIYKNKNVSFGSKNGSSGTNYNHAELSDVTDGVGPALAKHDLAYRWNIHQASGAITVDCILTHVAGHFETVTMTAAPDNSGMKNAIQQIASTTTYLQRYTLLAITGMSTKGVDDDARTAYVEPEQDAKELDWIACGEGLGDLAEYKAKKAELLACYGDAKHVPKSVLHAFNARFAELKAANHD
jgi:hypothetical protein